MHCPHCKQLIEDEHALYCGHCGRQLDPQLVHGAVVSENVAGDLSLPQQPSQPLPRLQPAMPISPMAPLVAHSPLSAPLPSQQLPPGFQVSQPLPAVPSTGLLPSKGNFNRFSPPAISSFYGTRQKKRGRAFLIIILVLVVVGISAGFLTLLQNGHSWQNNQRSATTTANHGVQGTVLFSASMAESGITDSLKLTVSGLASPAPGTHYAVWVLDEQEHTQALGTLTQQDQSEHPDQKSPSFILMVSNPGSNILSMGNMIEVTLETQNNNLPTGHIVLIGSLPRLAFLHIQHLLVQFPTTPDQKGLLTGLLQQTEVLQAQAQLLKNNRSDTLQVQCITQSMPRLIEGSSSGSFVSEACAQKVAIGGDGYGLLGKNKNGYVPMSAAHASLAATQIDATKNIKSHASEVIIATTNLTGWLTTINQDALSLQTDPTNQNKINEIIRLANNALNGADLNDNGNIDAVAGEAGAITAYLRGQLMATMQLAPPNH